MGALADAPAQPEVAAPRMPWAEMWPELQSLALQAVKSPAPADAVGRKASEQRVLSEPERLASGLAEQLLWELREPLERVAAPPALPAAARQLVSPRLQALEEAVPQDEPLQLGVRLLE